MVPFDWIVPFGRSRSGGSLRNPRLKAHDSDVSSVSNHQLIQDVKQHRLVPEHAGFRGDIVIAAAFCPGRRPEGIVRDADLAGRESE
jgi:hypothetical protein